MSDTGNNDKENQFNEFFSIKNDFNVNVRPLNKAEVANFDTFILNMPHSFKLASEIITLDQAALKPLQGIAGVAGQLVEYLNHQTQKIDLLVNYIISQQDDEKARFQGLEFGGGGIVFSSKEALAIAQQLEIKIFLLEENCAIYCHGEVITSEKVASEKIDNEKINESYHHKIVFNHIRDEDRENLVRTSLHLQSKQLQALSKQRSQKKKRT